MLEQVTSQKQARGVRVWCSTYMCLLEFGNITIHVCRVVQSVVRYKHGHSRRRKRSASDLSTDGGTYEGSADKSLARPTSRSCRTELIVSLERGVCSCAELQVFFLVMEAERKHVRRRTQFQQHRDASYYQFFFSYKARRRSKFTPFWQKHYGNMHHRIPPSKTGWPSWKVVIFPPVMRHVLDDPKQWPHWRLLIKYELILEDRWISAKSVAAQLGISREWVGSIIHEDLDMRKLSAKWGPEMPERGSKTSTVPFVWVTFGIFFGAIQMISCRDWWTWTKPGYITMTRRQSNKQWSGGITAHLAPKNSECKIPLENFSPRFFVIKMASSLLVIFQRAKLSTWNITHPCWCNWRTF